MNLQARSGDRVASQDGFDYSSPNLVGDGGLAHIFSVLGRHHHSVDPGCHIAGIVDGHLSLAVGK